jgi:hypothetical protein
VVSPSTIDLSTASVIISHIEFYSRSTWIDFCLPAQSLIDEKSNCPTLEALHAEYINEVKKKKETLLEKLRVTTENVLIGPGLP